MTCTEVVPHELKTCPAAVRRSMGWLAGMAASILVLVPCFWQSRIQAGDLSSHLYNAWLAQLIERGQAPGLSLARQSNNILFDLVLSGLLGAAHRRLSGGAGILLGRIRVRLVALAPAPP